MMLAEAPATQQHMEDLLLAHRLQEEEDQSLARKLQGEEIHKVGVVREQRGFTAFESEVYRLGHKSTIDSEEDSGETEYDYTEPQRGQAIEWPILYDKYQKAEDKEIGHVSKRHPCKRINAAPTALHHRSVDQRGKVVKDKPVYNKPAGPTRGAVVPATKQFAQGDLTDYGLVLKTPGPAQFVVYVWSTGQTILCKPQGKLKNLSQFKNKTLKGVKLCWPTKSCVVMLHFRYYQKNKAEIVTALSDTEYSEIRTSQAALFSTHDLCVDLPSDLLTKIKAYLAPEDLSVARQVSNHRPSF